MELFRLFGSILVNNDEANSSISKTEDKAEGLSKKLGEGIRAAAKWGLGLAAGAGIGLAAFVKAGDDLQDALNSLQSQTGSSSKEMGGMKDSLENIYKNNYGKDFKDIADSMGLVKQNTGLAGKALEDTTKNALILRDTFDMDVSESTNTANSMMKQFGISSEQAFNLMAQGAQNGANKNGDMLDSLNEYAPQFAAMGFSADQFTNVLIDGAKNGQFSIDKVGDSMKEFNIRSKDMSTTSMDAFKSLGLNGEQMSQGFAKGGESAQKSFNQVMTSLNSIKDPVEKNRIGVELFGAGFEDLEAKGIASLANIGNTASTSKDSLGEIDKVRYDSLGNALTGIGRNIMMGLFIPFQDKVMPKMNEFAQWVTDHMPQIQSGIKSAMDIASKGFDGLKKAVKFVIDNMNILLPGIAGITGAVVAQMVINGLVNAYKAWQTATRTQTTMQWLLNAALNANPLGLVALAIGAVIAIGVLLWKNWDTVKSKAGQLWTGMKSIFGKIGSFVGGVWDGMVGGIKGSINKIIGAMNSMIGGLNKIKVKVPDWVPGFGGKGFGFNISRIPMLAEGGDITKKGRVIVGERGPEILDLPQGARVTPLDKTNNSSAQHITVEAPIILDGYEIAKAIFPTIDLMQANQFSTRKVLSGVKGK